MRRAAAVVGVAVGALLLLTSCVPLDEVSVRSTGDWYEFVFCDIDAAESIRVDQVVDGNPDVQTTVWAVEGAPTLDGPLLIRFGEVPEGWTETVAPSDFDPDFTELYIAVTAAKGDDIQVGSFDPAKIGDDDWLYNDGSIHPNECA